MPRERYLTALSVLTLGEGRAIMRPTIGALGETVAAIKFEYAMARLEIIVAELEKGDLPLDDSLKIFEEGIRLSKTCLKMLEDAERKVEILVQEKDGKRRIQAFSLDDAEPEPPL